MRLSSRESERREKLSRGGERARIVRQLREDESGAVRAQRVSARGRAPTHSRAARSSSTPRRVQSRRTVAPAEKPKTITPRDRRRHARQRALVRAWRDARRGTQRIERAIQIRCARERAIDHAVARAAGRRRRDDQSRSLTVVRGPNVIARPSTPSAASRVASLSVGCGWTVSAMSSLDAPNSSAASSATSSTPSARADARRAAHPSPHRRSA